MRRLRITVDGKVFDVTVEILDEETPQEILEAALNLAVQAPAGPAPSPPSTPSASEVNEPGVVQSPISGKVVSLDVNPGDKVEKGDRLLTIEAMKMYNYINSPQAGKVAAIFVAPGSTV